jgi:hypothetical protein
MDPCKDLIVKLEFLIEFRSERRINIIGRAFFSVFGLEFLWDLIYNDKKVELNWSTFIDFLILLDIAAALNWLRVHGLTEIVEQLGKRIGPWGIIIWLAILILEIGSAISSWLEVSEDFEKEIAEIYKNSDCNEKDKIFKEKGLEIPK